MSEQESTAVARRETEADLPSRRVRSFEEMKALASAIAESGLFGMKTETQVLALMAVAEAEGKHPATVARDYDIIQGRPAKRAEAMLRDFLAAGGSVKWHALNDQKADATFGHPQGGQVRISWDMDRVKKAGLASKDNYKKYPRAMLRSRCVSEGVRTVWPSATGGMHVPEEAQDFEVLDAIEADAEAEAEEAVTKPAELSDEAMERKLQIVRTVQDIVRLERGGGPEDSVEKDEAAEAFRQVTGKESVRALRTEDDIDAAHEAVIARKRELMDEMAGDDESASDGEELPLE